MFDHVGFAVKDFEKSMAFYTKALAPLGIRLKMQITREMTGGEAQARFGVDTPQFWFGEGQNIEAVCHLRG